MLRCAALLVALMFAAGCAAPPKAATTPSLFAVVPSSDGHVGKIVVTSGGESRVIDTAYGAQRVNSDGALVPAKLTAESVRKDFGTTLDALPGKPASFMLYFLEGRDELTSDSKAELQRVFTELRKRPLPDIAVIGHTDTVGGLAYNDRLSLARAERMRTMMVEMGIPSERILAAGRGKRELLVATDDNIPEPRNRRVEISVR